MNLKDAIKNLSNEEICEILPELINRLREGQKEPPTEHFYEFTGTWSWGTWATSREEAEKFFQDAYTDDFNILTDEYAVERMEE